MRSGRETRNRFFFFFFSLSILHRLNAYVECSRRSILADPQFLSSQKKETGFVDFLLIRARFLVYEVIVVNIFYGQICYGRMKMTNSSKKLNSFGEKIYRCITN